MQWYEEVLKRIDGKKTYCHKELMDELRMLKTDLSDSTYHWAISGLVRDGALTRYGYDSYSLTSDHTKDEYVPVYSDTAEGLIRLISEKYPYVQFMVFETVLMNEFLNHLIAQNTVFIQVEKESSIYVFRFLQEQGIQNVMYKPGKKDFNLYWSKDCVIVTDMISEAPIRADKPHYIMLEKMLVDMSADKLIAVTFSKAELPDVYEQAQSRYLLDKVRMLRYSRRRNRQDVLLKYLEGEELVQLELVPKKTTPAEDKLVVHCFGHFDVYWKGEPVFFARKQSKELLAYLVDRQGAACSAGEIAIALWEKESCGKVEHNRIRVLINDLKKTLQSIGMEQVLIREHRELAIRKDLIDCDYYRMLEGDMDAVNSYRGEYMLEYSWAEITNADLRFRRQ